MKRFLQTGSALLGTLALCTATFAQVNVVNRSVDVVTQGDWTMSPDGSSYGSCFFIVPDPVKQTICVPGLPGDGTDSDNPSPCREQPVGPDPSDGNKDGMMTNLEQYRYNTCYGGSLVDLNDANDSDVAWSIFRTDDVTGDRRVAFVFDYETGRSGTAIPEAAQWNPCIQRFRHTTFDNELFIFDPMSGEIEIELAALNLTQGQTLRLAYYFTNERGVCRTQNLDLFADGALIDMFSVDNISDGKYVVYEVGGLDTLPGPTVTFRLETNDRPGAPTCSNPADTTPGVNSVLSGIFVSGAACDTPPPPDEEPCIDLEKEISIDGGATFFIADTPGTAPVTTPPSGALYRLTATNCGTEPLENVTVSDATLGIPPTLIADLAVGEVRVLTQNEIPGLSADLVCDRAGTFTNTAIIDANGALSGGPVSADDPAVLICEEQPGGGEGCTPGYWKQEHHFDSWVGFSPADDYETVFGVDASFTKTLVGALRQGGGGEKALGRHAVAALLNSASGGVSYAFSTAEVIAIVQQAYLSGDFKGAKNELEGQNELGCPLN